MHASVEFLSICTFRKVLEVRKFGEFARRGDIEPEPPRRETERRSGRGVRMAKTEKHSEMLYSGT